jgi:hypothetical protein
VNGTTGGGAALTIIAQRRNRSPNNRRSNHRETSTTVPPAQNSPVAFFAAVPRWRTSSRTETSGVPASMSIAAVARDGVQERRHTGVDRPWRAQGAAAGGVSTTIEVMDSVYRSESRFVWLGPRLGGGDESALSSAFGATGVG